MRSSAVYIDHGLPPPIPEAEDAWLDASACPESGWRMCVDRVNERIARSSFTEQTLKGAAWYVNHNPLPRCHISLPPPPLILLSNPLLASSAVVKAVVIYMCIGKICTIVSAQQPSSGRNWIIGLLYGFPGFGPFDPCLSLSVMTLSVISPAICSPTHSSILHFIDLPLSLSLSWLHELTPITLFCALFNVSNRRLIQYSCQNRGRRGGTNDVGASRYTINEHFCNLLQSSWTTAKARNIRKTKWYFQTIWKLKMKDKDARENIRKGKKKW